MRIKYLLLNTLHLVMICSFSVIFAACESIQTKKPTADELQFQEVSTLAEGGDASAQFRLSDYYLKGYGTDQNATAYQKWITESAESGYLSAQKKYADDLLEGEVVQRNVDLAIQWLERAAEQKDRQSQRKLVTLYTDGKHVPKNVQKAVQWTRPLAEQGDSSAIKSLATIYETGEGIPKDIKESTVWHAKLAQRGDKVSQRKLAVWYEEGQDIKKNLEEAFKWREKLARTGDSESIQIVASMYESGNGVTKNVASAKDWHKKAALSGDAKSTEWLCLYYSENGAGKNPVVEYYWLNRKNSGQKILDRIKAVEQELTGDQLFEMTLKASDEFGRDQVIMRMYEKAAMKGALIPQYGLGIKYFYESKYTEAIKWLEMAAKQNHYKAQAQLGKLYSDGKGVPKNLDKAEEYYLAAAKSDPTGLSECSVGAIYEVRGNHNKMYEYFKKSSDKGYINGAYMVGQCLFFGRGVRLNKSEAAKYFTKAADCGHPDAMHNLHIMYRKGDGVPRDITLSSYYLLTACSFATTKRGALPFSSIYQSKFGRGVNLNNYVQRVTQGMIKEGLTLAHAAAVEKKITPGTIKIFMNAFGNKWFREHDLVRDAFRKNESNPAFQQLMKRIQAGYGGRDDIFKKLEADPSYQKLKKMGIIR